MTDTLTQSTRRQWLATTAAGLAGSAVAGRAELASAQAQPPAASPLPLTEFEPKSMLHVAMTTVQGARFPVIDFHTHVSRRRATRPPVPPAELLKTMDAVNLRTMVNLTGGFGEDLSATIAAFDRAFPRRFLSMTEPAWTRAAEAGYARWQADEIAKAKAAGAVGVKVLKTLGLYLRDGGPTGKLVRVDDPRFDPMWEACGRLGMPVAMHVGDPEAFFLPIDRFNERYEELHAHPDWSFHGKDFPGNRELQEARRNVMRRHPKTQFVCLHVANSEDLPYVSECLDSHPNMFVDIAARIGELGRQPRTARKFFDKHQDRIVFGTDASAGTSTPQQTFGDALYEIYFRFLETEDEYFDYAPAPVPPQGRWRISGLGLSEQILRKVYRENAARLIGIPA